MIKSLHISNYALIDTLDIDFASGLNIITGETGAGKSIILGALSMLLGGRADAKVISDTERKSVVEGEFVLDDLARFESLISYNELDQPADNILILRREISPGGRSRAFVNDTPVNLSTLRDFAVRLVDIHSQHQNLLLADADYQLRIIDSIADTAEDLAEYSVAYDAYQAILRRYTSTRDMLRRGRDEADFISYQLDELNELNLSVGEAESLEDEHRQLAEARGLSETITRALQPLDGDVDITMALRESISAISEIDNEECDADALAARLSAAMAEISDVADTLRELAERCDFDEAQFDAIEHRLDKIHSISAKHHIANADDLVELRNRLAEQLDAITNGDDIMARLEAEAVAAKKVAMLAARRISEKRRAAADVFGRQLYEAAKPLGMSNLRCEIAMTTGKLTPTGIDRVDFLVSFNKNQVLTSIGQSASGGEISRLMLSVKSIVGEKMNLPTIVFDEIDTGVSGSVAACMGELMLSMSKGLQVIAITHLPQVAAKGVKHFKVYKQDDDTRTTTRIRALSHDERVDELASMIGGRTVDRAARDAANSLLNNE